MQIKNKLWENKHKPEAWGFSDMDLIWVGAVKLDEAMRDNCLTNLDAFLLLVVLEKENLAGLNL